MRLGRAIDVYVEPFSQARRLLVAGATPVADSLTRLARSMDYDVVRVVDGREQRDIETATPGVTVVGLDALEAWLREGVNGGGDLSAVVVSQGHYDEDALEPLLRSGVPYVGLVASRQRAAAVRAQLEERGVPGAATIRNQPGSISARGLRQKLRCRSWPKSSRRVRVACPQSCRRRLGLAGRAAASEAAVDPVCGMSVTIASARQKAELDGVTYYFCCANCRTKFSAILRRLARP